MQNNRSYSGNGYPRYDNIATTSRSFDGKNARNERWREAETETEWSARDETWRGNPRHNPSPSQRSIAAAEEDRRRNDSWTSPSFQLGRDRAPMPINDQFLDRYGAKRLNNGNLVDRDGYTLRLRDPDCQAPSPPNYNPGREARRAPPLPQETNQPPSRFLDRLTQADLDKKARQQMEMMKRLAEEQEQKSRKEQEMKEENEEKKKKKANGRDGTKRKIQEEVEGEDEYEDVEEPVATEAKVQMPKPSAYVNNIKRPLLTSPPTLSPSALRNNRPMTNGPSSMASTYQKPESEQKQWYTQYKKHVESVKEQVYGSQSAQQSGYFFQPTPSTSGSVTRPLASPGYPPASSSYHHPRTPSTSSTTSSSPFYQNSSGGASYRPPPIQMDLPPPGVVSFPRSTPTPPGGPSRYAQQYLSGNSNINGMNNLHNGMTMSPFGVWNSNGTQQPSHVAPPPIPAPSQQLHQPPPPPKEPLQSPSSSDSEEDEAIIKLREIIKNYGTQR